jgi:uncharacterized protein
MRRIAQQPIILVKATNRQPPTCMWSAGDRRCSRLLVYRFLPSDRAGAYVAERFASMDQIDFEGARQHALGCLERELSPAYVYHSLAHTRDDVVPAAEWLAGLEGVQGEALLLLCTAAYFHDVGLLRQRTNHEAAGVQIAAIALPRFGYRPAQIQAIGGMIMATQLPQRPCTPLEALLADADLDVLGRTDYICRNRALRTEMELFDGPIGDAQWYGEQLDFIQSHRYWTAAARALRDEQKHANRAALLRLIEECKM